MVSKRERYDNLVRSGVSSSEALYITDREYGEGNAPPRATNKIPSRRQPVNTPDRPSSSSFKQRLVDKLKNIGKPSAEDVEFKTRLEIARRNERLRSADKIARLETKVKLKKMELDMVPTHSSSHPSHPSSTIPTNWGLSAPSINWGLSPTQKHGKKRKAPKKENYSSWMP